MTAKSEDFAFVPADGQRRYLTLLFADLTGSVSLSEQLEAEDYAEMLGQLRSLCRDIIPRFGGLVVRLQGDGLLAMFGHPEPREDDGRRATQAAIELHAAVRALPRRGPLGGPLSLHSGIHAGLVLLAPGDLELGRFELMGPTPNIAARLCSCAGPDELVVSEESLGPHAQFFVSTDPEHVLVKGREEPLWIRRVLRVASPKDRIAAGRRDLGPLVGRADALGLLYAHAAALPAAPVPRCVALCGGAGLGKTRLVDEFLRDPSLAAFAVLRAHCESVLTAEPLQPFTQVVRSIAAQAEDDDALGSACLRVLRGESGAVPEVFDRLAARQPLLLVIDDWHWADEVSQRALDAVLRLPRPIRIVLTTRTPAEGLPAATPLIHLLPFDDQEATAAIQRLLPSADPFMVAEINRYAGGIPLFIEELCHSAATHGAPALSNLRGSGRAWLNVLIESRVERLPPAQARLVRAASVLGSVFPAWLLERLTGHAADSADLQDLATKDFIYAGDQPGSLRFKHGITRDAIYETVGLRERKEMHRQIALTLQAVAAQASSDDLLEALAYHCALGGMPHDAALYAERAGDKANAASALDRARAQYAAALRALDMTAPLPREAQLRWCAIAEKLGWASVFDPLALGDGLATFERSVALARACDDARALARAQYWLGYVCYARGLARSAITHCDTALELALGIGDTRLVSQVRGTLGQALLSACEYDRARGLLDAALESRPQPAQARGKVAVGPAYSLACKGYLLGDRGDFDGADECFDEALQLLGGVQHQVAASVRHWMSVVWLWQGRWQDALEAADEAARIATHVKSRQQLAMGRALAGHARWMLAGDPQALQAVREATAWIEARSGKLATSLNHGWIVVGALAERRTAEARRHAALLLLRARAEDRIGEALGCRALARAASAAGNAGEATRWLRRAQQSAQIRGSAHEHASNLLCEAHLENDRGRRDAARGHLDRACTAFESLRMQWHLRQAQAGLAATGESSARLPAFPPP